MTDTIFVQLHIGDFIGDTLDMDATEIGAYWLLLLAHYKNGVMGIPSDEAKLRRITRINDRRIWARVKDVILSKFTEKDGWLTNGRVIEEIKKRTKKPAKSEPKVSELTHDLENESVRKSEDKSLELNETQKHNLKPITNNPFKKEKIQKEKGDFEEFWKLCPRRVGKGDAEAKYWKAREEVSREFLLAAIEAHAKECKGRDQQYIPHPGTWLHQKRYHDETATMVVVQEKRDWPTWKTKIAAVLGDHVVKGWFNTATLIGQEIVFGGKFEFDRVKQFHEGDLKNLGFSGISHRRPA